MSYPKRDSSFIDMRSRIRTPILKTRLILNELDNMTRASSSLSGRFSNSPASSLAPPPRLNRSIAETSDSPVVETPPRRSIRPSPYMPGRGLAVEARHTPVLKSVNRGRNIDRGYKSNVFSVDDIEVKDPKEDAEVEKAKTILKKDIFRKCFLNGHDEIQAEFKFDVPVVRGPRKAPTPEKEAEPPAKLSKIDQTIVQPVVSTPASTFTFPSTIKKTEEKKESPSFKISNFDSNINSSGGSISFVTSNNEIVPPVPTFNLPKSSKWDCPNCMVQNTQDKETCPCCETLKPGSSNANQAAVNKSAGPAFKPQSFSTPLDGSFSFGVPKTDSVPKVPSFGITIPPVVSVSNSDDSSIPSTPVPSNSFFGTPKVTFTSAFGGPPAEPTSSDKSAPKASMFGSTSGIKDIFGGQKTEEIPKVPTFPTTSATSKIFDPPKSDAAPKTSTFGAAFATNKPLDNDGPVTKMPNFGAATQSIFNKPKTDPAPPFPTKKQNIFGAQKSDSVPIFSGLKTDPIPSVPTFRNTTNNSFAPPNTNGSSGSEPAVPSFDFNPSSTSSNNMFATANSRIPSEFKFDSSVAPKIDFASAAMPSSNNAFSFTSSATTTINNGSTPFVFGGAPSNSSAQVPAAPTFVPLNSGTSSFPPFVPDSSNPFSISSGNSTSAIGRKKLTAKRKKF